MENKVKKPRRARKHDHEGGHHGGSWKVAYADFVTAMMAFFLLLWLVSMVSDEKKASVAHYFKYFGVFDESGASLFVDGKQGEAAMKVPGSETIKEETEQHPPESPEAAPPAASAEENSMDEFMEHFKKEVESKLANLKEQILMEEFEGGLRIEIMDKEGNPMFPLGSSEMSDNGKNILKVFNESLSDANQKVALEGHTDARVIASAYYSNWELSTQRASAARKALEQTGLNPARLIRVSGYAATQPLIKEDPYDPRNRRISILLFDSSRAPKPAQQDAVETSEPSPEASQVESAADRPEKDPIEAYLFNH